jgi:D-beta-D-heptose 7-phosphate kinase/D-beta-D-heptose 1-phosphate adenosyltransferase
MTHSLPTPRTWQDDTAAELADAARQLSGGSVLVVGDAMLDRYFYGEATRISQEAPVPVLCLQRELSLPGGAANVVRNITAVGAAAAFVAVVGDDMAGSDLTVQGSRITTVKTRFLAQGQHLLRADTEDPGPLHPKIAERLVRIATDAMTATSVTILSDYSKGVLAGDVPARLIQAARKAGRPIIVDPRGGDYAGYAGADVIMPNRRELAAITGLSAETDEDIETAARTMLERHKIGAALITRSEHGMSLVTPSEAWHFPAEALDVHDVSGAGDTVAAVLAAGKCQASDGVTRLMPCSPGRMTSSAASRRLPATVPRSSAVRPPSSRPNAGGAAAGASASPTAASTGCTRAMSICWSRRAGPATA